MPNFISNISPVEIGVIILILVMFFGSRIVTGIAKTSGETVREIKKIKKSFTESLEDDDDKKDKEAK